jgi:uncharacterized protein YbcI
MKQENSLPTVGQLERELNQKISALYRSQLNHQPNQVSCQLSGNTLTVVLENAVTQPEQLLNSNGDGQLVEQIRERIDKIIQPQLQELIEEILQVQVADILSDVTIETGRGGLIVVLSSPPAVRPPQASRQKSPA